MMFKNHPKGLQILFFTEMWERFSYYGMRGILLLFMVNAVETGGFGMDAATAGAIYGLYTAMVYLLALPGGWIADRIMGQRNAVFLGGIIIAAGHFSMAVPMQEFFYAGLVLIVIGTGLLKPNISAIIGDLYPEGGARRDAGFSIFYMGINVGAFAGPLVCGFLGETIDWHLGFSAAGFGMVAGLIQYKIGLKHLGEAGHISTSAVAGRSKDMRLLLGGFGAVLFIIISLLLLSNSGILNITLTDVVQIMGVVIVSIAIIYFLYIIIFGGLESRQKKRIVVIFFLFIGAAMFWSGFEQAGSSMNLFADRLTDRVIVGWEMPASWLQSVNPLFIIAFAPVFGWLWVWLGSREPSIPVKFGLGLLLLGSGFLVMAWASTFTMDGGKVTPLWLIMTYFLHTAGELCLSPIGLSSVTKLSPRRLVGQMMGIWFMGSALGNLIAGLVAGQFETLPLPDLFGIVCLVTAGCGILFLIFSKPIKKLIGDLKENSEATT
jgi:proton-dependent oligopeptide transporter, POT family